MARNWKPSKAAAADFAAKMAEIEQFCRDHQISQSLSGDSYYFTIGGNFYRVSNHTVAASNNAAFDDMGNQIRELYHEAGEKGMICITAGKTRIIEIYKDLEAGHTLDRRGNRIK